jgi:DNA-binding XRE family transcriptional regulator
MSYEAAPTQQPISHFRTVESADEVTIEQEDAVSLQVTIPYVQGFITRDAAVELGWRLINAAKYNPPPEDATPKAYRERAGMSQSEAATKLGISRTYLSKIERGQAKEVSLRICRRMAQMYNCGVGELGIEIPE